MHEVARSNRVDAISIAVGRCKRVVRAHIRFEPFAVASRFECVMPNSTDKPESNRPRALPIPKGCAELPLFTPDSSIASDVIPSANFGER